MLSDLVEAELAHTGAFRKEIAKSEDLTFICGRLWPPEYMFNFSNMFDFLTVAPFIPLLVDTCERGGALARASGVSKPKCKEWKDIEFYTDMSDDEDSPTMNIRVKVPIK